MEAGTAAGIGLRIRIGTGAGPGEPAHEVAADLAEALALLRSRFAPAESNPGGT
jgi:hypothetical protein